MIKVGEKVTLKEDTITYLETLDGCNFDAIGLGQLTIDKVLDNNSFTLKGEPGIVIFEDLETEYLFCLEDII